MKKIVSLFLIAAVLFLSSCSTKNVEQMPQKQSQNKADNAVATKNAAQDFKLKTIDGNEVSLADYKGKAIVLNFFATWCPPCRAEFPGFIQMVEEYKNDDGIVFLFVNVAEDKGVVNNFLKDRNYNIKPLLDEKGEVSSLYGVVGLPTTVIIDKEFNIFTTHVGFMEKRDLKNLIERVK